MELAFYGELGALLKKHLAEKPYFDKLVFSDLSAGLSKRCDVFFCDEVARFPLATLKARLCVLPNTVSSAPPYLLCPACVSCGMQAHDSVSFSSIGENSAMLCLTRTVPFGKKLLEPFEARTEYFRAYSIYQNLALSFAALLCDFCFVKVRQTACETLLRQESEERYLAYRR